MLSPRIQVQIFKKLILALDYVWGGGTWVIRTEHTGILTKNPILIRFYHLVHQLPAPSAPEGGTLYLLPFENSKSHQHHHGSEPPTP